MPDFDFALGENALAIRETTARFARDRIAPRAAEIDASNAFPRDLWPEMGALGGHYRGGGRYRYRMHCRQPG